MEDQPVHQGTVDYATLEQLDPSLVDGFQLFFEREVPFELRSAMALDLPTEMGALEGIRVRILRQLDGEHVKAVRVELCSESNLFFLYVHELDERSFREVQVLQRLMADFQDYPTILMRMLNQAIREPHAYLAVFIMHPTGEARLDFIQNMEYKFVELLSCKFVAAAEELIRLQVSYRYNVVRARLQLMEARLADVSAMVRVRDPSLLLQLQRTPPRSPSMARQSPNRPKPFYP
ncbi:hypothetical protein VOLCADRAFT_88953 [Volvox carteri f. nagariensis]|uniref:Spindle assembly abnormal protein 6 N-terminal domain-containing protein n=1 Tax=Volvox carteri f. nagariensis TaxID=3068 RepID=D8TQE5_VOLCA|nr:uncharacterized protein VOLCADRAFT_88953 [Volvox carteri f. nagariensis]EFJ50391.1 hypothetical protein VOLCADRAFT_88953 [Volvox carteri f. nagariensis]|eukprot:XP_002948516.1 hypothetical protein VOLCADRAFT_88953 [Volvox carteri f. nagariensis]